MVLDSCGTIKITSHNTIHQEDKSGLGLGFIRAKHGDS